MKMPDVAEMTVEEVVDELGKARDAQKEIKQREGYLKENLLARAREGSMTMVEGKKYSAVITVETRSGLDTAAIRAAMSDEWIAAHSKGSEFFKVTVKPN